MIRGWGGCGQRLGWTWPGVGVDVARGWGQQCSPQRRTAGGPTTGLTIPTLWLLYSTCPLRLAALMRTTAVLSCRYKVFWYVTIVAALANAFIEPYKLAFTNAIYFG